mgnify:CR=1 FL=1|tara:strand:- start:32 stop:547 length:516 start_codon:yes stop_codon:yes gene_type:complete
MLENFNISKFKAIKPPKDNSLKTLSEIKKLEKIPIDESFVKKYDNVKDNFYNIVKDSDIKQLLKESIPHIEKIKKYFNRPRPKELAKNFGIKLDNIELGSMKTASYPSGHSIQAYLLADYLKQKYPEKSNELNKLADNISDSRKVARAHYDSDSKFGKTIGLEMSKHVKEQ